MQQEFQKHIREHFPFIKEKKVLIACSGGGDSVVLAYLLQTLPVDTSLVHCNFSLRGKESDEDAKFVKRLAKQLQIPVYIETFDTEQYANDKNISLQMAARELRYQWFEELADIVQSDYVATAHHADDDVETFLIHLGRGTGLSGLTGIPKTNGRVIRPLLPFSREEILKYATKEGIKWREDSSNAETKYLRNKLRHDVIPDLKKATPQFLQNFKTTQKYLQDSALLIEDYVALVFTYVVEQIPSGFQLDVEKLKKLPNTKALLYELLHPFGFTAWDDVLHLLYSQSGKQVHSTTHQLLRHRNHLLLTERKESEVNETTSYWIAEGTKKMNKPVSLHFSEEPKAIPGNKNVIYVDKSQLQFPLELRKWQAGDVFYPFGMQGKKKISKFFKDEKLSLLAKQQIWLLCSNQQIVWVVGMRADERFKVTPKTKDILKIAFQE